MFANLRPVAARWTLLLLDRILRRRYMPRHARQSGPSFIDRRRTALLRTANAGHMTALEYLLGIGFPEAERYASAFGRVVAAQYRLAHGVEPYMGCLADVRGRIHRGFGYDVADLYAGALVYKRTAAFLAEQRTVALAELTAA